MNKGRELKPIRIKDLPTPALLLDRERMMRNIHRVLDRAKTLGVPVRAHLKTPKSLQVARILQEAGVEAFTISTLREADYFVEHGITDLLYASAIAPAKIERVAAIMRKGASLLCVVDSLESAVALSKASTLAGAIIPVLIELNVDDYRAGVSFNDLDQVAKFVEGCPSIQFRGFLSYAGASYHTAPGQRGALAEQHRHALLDAGRRVGRSDLVLSFGSTPALMKASTMAGVTEFRGGVFVFQDLFQAGIEACALDDISLSVASTVVSHQRSTNRLFIDAGGLALSKDRSTANTSFDAGYGLVMNEKGDLIQDLFVKNVHQELGEVTTRTGACLTLDDFPVGTVLRILPNHADMTAAAYETYHVISGDFVIDQWDRVNGW